MSIFQEIKKISKKYPNKIALVIDSEEFTYSQLVKEVEAVSMFFSSLKIKSKDIVGIIENNTIILVNIIIHTLTTALFLLIYQLVLLY